jgi:hypothetical protein
MQRHVIVVAALSLLTQLSPAAAEPYISAQGLLANTSDPTLCNTGYTLAIGQSAAPLRYEIEASQHRHLCNTTAAFMGMTYFDYNIGPVTTYLGIGGGFTVNRWSFDRPVIQGALGISMKATSSLSWTLGYAQRCYGSLSKFCHSRDGYLTIGIHRNF